MWLRRKTGGSGIGPHEWKHDGAVIKVPEHLGRELLDLDPGEYSVAEPPTAVEPAPPAPPAPPKPEPVKAAAEPAKGKPAARHGKAGDSGS